MNAFFLLVIAAYGGMHVYAFQRARSVIGFGWVPGLCLALFMLLMTCAFFLIRAFERQEYESITRGFAYIAYFWMAFLFLFFSVSVLFDAVGLIARTASFLTKTGLYLPPASTTFYLCIGLSFTICIYGYFDAKNIRTEIVRIETSKLPAGTDRFVIAQISDVHLGLINREERLECMLQAVYAAHPDMVISTGDLVDARINHIERLLPPFCALQPKFGKYAITGNHEYYAGIKRAVAFEEHAGFVMLQNEITTAGPIVIAGLNDPTAARMNLEKPIDEKELLEKAPGDRFVLLLKHQPLVNRDSEGLFDLQLSGHTHKGQIFPFTLLTLITYPYNAGDYLLRNGSRLHVSRGTGTWGPPIRFLSPPEVTIIELVRAS
jgi:predicted MPP superfamily phosphohydrolase